MKNIAKFKKSCHDSPAVKLMLPNLNSRTIYLGKESGFLASIAYCAWKNKNLARLDYLIEKFNIVANGTLDFKNRLEEKWLEKEENRRRNVAINTTAAIAELVIADYLLEEGQKILNLSAIKEKSPDITYMTDSKDKFYCEVKYLEDAPELYESRIRASKFSGVDNITLPNDSQTLNYLFSRIADSAIQLHRYRIKSRCVFLVFHELANLHSRSTLEDNLYNFKNWYQYSEDDYPGVLGKNSSKILRHNPYKWLNKTNILLIGTMIDFKLENVLKYTF